MSEVSSTHGVQSSNLTESLAASPISLQWQSVAQRMISSSRLVEVSLGVFSTCQEQIEDFGQRLIRARDTATPLVEIDVATKEADVERLREMLGLDGVMATRLRTATGEEKTGRGHRERILEYDDLGYVTHGGHPAGKYGDYLKTVFDWGTYEGYTKGERNIIGRPAQPMHGVSSAYEDGILMIDDPVAYAGHFLVQAAELFHTAILRDGSVPGEVVREQLHTSRRT